MPAAMKASAKMSSEGSATVDNTDGCVLRVELSKQSDPHLYGTLEALALDAKLWFAAETHLAKDLWLYESLNRKTER